MRSARKRDLSPPSGRGAAARQLLVVPPGPEQPARSSSPIEHRPVAKLPPRNDLRSGTVFAPSTAITGEAGFRSEAVEMLARTRRVRPPGRGISAPALRVHRSLSTRSTSSRLNSCGPAVTGSVLGGAGMSSGTHQRFLPGLRRGADLDRAVRTWARSGTNASMRASTLSERARRFSSAAATRAIMRWWGPRRCPLTPIAVTAIWSPLRGTSSSTSTRAAARFRCLQRR